jgi:hypothetical protein
MADDEDDEVEDVEESVMAKSTGEQQENDIAP